MTGTAPRNVVVSDRTIPGAVALNPALAADFYQGRFLPFDSRPGGQEPLETTDKVTSQYLASYNSPNYWKSQPAPAMSNAILFGNGKPQTPVSHPWIKKFIPPLALFNDASQWVNLLFFVQPMTWFGAATSFPPLVAQYFTPPPINTDNLGAGKLNLQLQLGNIAIQAQQLTISASNFFGGS